MNVLIVGPSSFGLKGGQVTHMENIKSLFGGSVSFFYSSSGREGTENSIYKLLRLIYVWVFFPLSLIDKTTIHLNTSFDSKAAVRDLVLSTWCAIFRKPLVIQYHGGSPESVRLLSKGLMLSVYRYIWRYSSVLVLTDEQGAWLEDRVGVSTKKMKNYVALPDISSKQGGGGVKFMYMGRVIKEKGLVEIIEAVKAIGPSHSFVVDIYGCGEDEKVLKGAVVAAGCSDRINFLGSVSGEDKEVAFLSADVFLYPSFYPEGLPYSVLEALSYQTAVICTDAGALKDLLVDGNTCLKVDMRSVESLQAAMVKVIDNKSSRIALAENGRNLIESELSLPVLKKTLLEVWRDAAA